KDVERGAVRRGRQEGPLDVGRSGRGSNPLIQAPTHQGGTHDLATGVSERVGDLVPTAKKTATASMRTRLAIPLTSAMRSAATSPSATNRGASVPDCSH